LSSPTEAVFRARAAEARKARVDTTANVEFVGEAPDGENSSTNDEPAASGPAVDAPKPHLCACFKVVKVSELLVPAHGRWLQGRLGPLLLTNASSLRIAESRGEVEIVLGVPQQPHDTEWLGQVETFGDDQTFEDFKLSSKGKAKIEQQAKKLMLTRAHSAFADKSPFDVAAEEIWAKRQTNVDKLKSRAQADLDYLTTRPLSKLAEKRAKAAELMAEAEAAEQLLAGVTLTSTDAATQEYELRAALEPFVRMSNGEDTGAAVHPTALAAIKALVRNAILAQQAGDWAGVGKAVEKLRAVRLSVGEGAPPALSAIGGGY
jgi:hypothetical protein